MRVMSDLLHKCQICAALIDAEDLFLVITLTAQ